MKYNRESEKYYLFVNNWIDIIGPPRNGDQATIITIKVKQHENRNIILKVKVKQIAHNTTNDGTTLNYS